MAAVQPYSAAQRLLGGFLNSTDPNGGSGGDSNSNKAPGFFSIRRYRKHFNVDTMVGTPSGTPNRAVLT